MDGVLINQCIEAAREIRDDIIILCHGGRISDPEDARFILNACPGCHGFYGASSMERFPTERRSSPKRSPSRRSGAKQPEQSADEHHIGFQKQRTIAGLVRSHSVQVPELTGQP